MMQGEELSPQRIPADRALLEKSVNDHRAQVKTDPEKKTEQNPNASRNINFFLIRVLLLLLRHFRLAFSSDIHLIF